MKTFLSTVVTLLWLLLPAIMGCNILSSLDHIDHYQQPQRNSVQVSTPTGKGSGVLIQRNYDGVKVSYVLTAAHVVDFPFITVSREIRKDGFVVAKQECRAQIIAQSVKQDLAILQLDVVWEGNTWFNFQVQEVGTEVIHVGNTLGRPNSTSRGIISQTDRTLDDVDFDQTTVVALPGSSGGGVFLPDGDCIGIVVRAASSGFNLIIPSRRILIWSKSVGLENLIDQSAPVTHHEDK